MSTLIPVQLDRAAVVEGSPIGWIMLFFFTFRQSGACFSSDEVAEAVWYFGYYSDRCHLCCRTCAVASFNRIINPDKEQTLFKNNQRGTMGFRLQITQNLIVLNKCGKWEDQGIFKQGQQHSFQVGLGDMKLNIISIMGGFIAIRIKIIIKKIK